MSREQTIFDPYKILNVDKNATDAEIKGQFRKLTLKYHPDRNRRTKDYDPGYYNNICKAYAILMDPEQRQMYHMQTRSQYIGDWNELRNGSKKLRTEQSKLSVDLNDRFSPNDRFVPKDRFSNNDLSQFNTFFEQRKTADPNDHGYGDEMLERTTKFTGHYNANVPGVSHDKMAYNKMDFNKRFESNNISSREIMEQSQNRQPQELISGSGGWTDIALFEGNMIIGRDTQDYSKQKSHANDLEYTDYKQSFSTTLSASLPSDLRNHYNNEKNIDRMFIERMSEQSANPYDELSPHERKSFQENKDFLIRQKQKEIESEQQKHRDIVMKYKHQYADNYLEHKKIELNPHSNPHSNFNSNPHSNFNSNPHSNFNSNSHSNPHSNPHSNSHFDHRNALHNNQLTRDENNNNTINKRMTERTFLF